MHCLSGVGGHKKDEEASIVVPLLYTEEEQVLSNWNTILNILTKDLQVIKIGTRFSNNLT